MQEQILSLELQGIKPSMVIVDIDYRDKLEKAIQGLTGCYVDANNLLTYDGRELIVITAMSDNFFGLKVLGSDKV